MTTSLALWVVEDESDAVSVDVASQSADVVEVVESASEVDAFLGFVASPEYSSLALAAVVVLGAGFWAGAFFEGVESGARWEGLSLWYSHACHEVM